MLGSIFGDRHTQAYITDKNLFLFVLNYKFGNMEVMVRNT